ncbi:matrixin family metalloprotease [Kitasatospora sp. NPDC096128]|uniref:matrixin family metalloprotease n=1 Tax=Kitasatospora sp. NPDC096128 TaxID=3155547 RepID=UPI003332F20F
MKLNTHYTQNYNAWTIKGIAVHELGHAMGIDHVSDHNAVMHPDAPGRNVNTPSADDTNGINALY